MSTQEPVIQPNVFDPLMQDANDGHIIEDLRPLARDISDLIPDPSNARRHDARNLEAIAASLRDHRVRTPIVVNKRTMYIEKGNGTYTAARMLGWTRLPVVFTDDDELQATDYGIRDNRTAELAKWNYQQAGAALRALRDAGQPLLSVGFDDAEAIPFLIGDYQPAAISDEEFNPDAQKGRSISKLTAPQRARIDEAVAFFRSKSPKPITEGQALAVICTDYLGRHGGAATTTLDVPSIENDPMLAGLGDAQSPPAKPDEPQLF
jgi:hypothetical protein